MKLSVVVASTDAARSIDRCLDCLARALSGVDAEVFVVDASRDDTAARVNRRSGPETLVRLPPGTLTPLLWAEGFRRSTGRIIALTTGHCFVPPAWATALMSAIDQGAAGSGGPVVLAADTGPVDWAVYFLRYSAFMPERLGSGRVVGEVAGDNAAYVRDRIIPHAEALADGFWEIDVHRLLRADGGWLAAVPAAAAQFGRSFPFLTILRHRFAHGRHFGASRVRARTRRAWQIVTAAPLVPALLAARAGARVFAAPRDRGRFAAALPWFLVLASSWAAGEVWGALRGAPR